MSASRKSKRELFELFERSLTTSGWSAIRENGSSTHPALYRLSDGGTATRVQVFIWNLTPGGRASIPDEWRVQVTGLLEPSGSQQFLPASGARTLILGWWNEDDMFAAFDASHHSAPLGKSPSLQIREGALTRAATDGMAHYRRGPTEIAFAIRPDLLAIYVQFQSDLHEAASSKQLLALIEEICADPASVSDDDISKGAPKKRQYAFASVRRAIRDASFRRRVLGAYKDRCAMCGLQLQLVEAAHIIPVGDPSSTDETSNGIALCSLHHRAYDRGLVTFDEGGAIRLSEAKAADLKALNIAGGMKAFKDGLRSSVRRPSASRDRPSPANVEKANALRGWSN